MNRTTLRMAIALATLGCVWGAGPAQAQEADPTATTETVVKSADLPEIDEMKAFSAEANFTSLAGRLRYLTYEHTGVWLQRSQATLALGSMMEAADR